MVKILQNSLNLAIAAPAGMANQQMLPARCCNVLIDRKHL